MSFERQLTFWLMALALVVAAIWLLSPILLPFVAGMVLAYLLNPLTNWLESRGLNRVVSALLIIGGFGLAFALLLVLLVPILIDQTSAMVTNLPDYIRKVQGLLVNPRWPWLQRLVGPGDIDTSVSDMVGQGIGWLGTFVRSLWSGGQALISIVSLMVITPVVAFYLIVDWPRMVATIEGWIPLQHRPTVNALAREIDTAIAGFVRGQTAVCLILGAFYAIGLTIVGLNFGLLIGSITGLIAFIPYVGSMVGLLLSVGIAIAQFWPEWTWVVVVLGIFLVGQFVEGNILAPKLVGQNVGLHPVWLMFAMLAFGYLFGALGLLVAVPLAAAVGVLLRFALRKYLASPFYTGKVPG
jgi:predicted PurR-regulated permease PerM